MASEIRVIEMSDSDLQSCRLLRSTKIQQHAFGTAGDVRFDEVQNSSCIQGRGSEWALASAHHAMPWISIVREAGTVRCVDV